MEIYRAKDESYEVFGANMTVDTQADVHSTGYHVACRSCQCHCRKCLGGILPENLEAVSQKEAEKVLKSLLAA